MKTPKKTKTENPDFELLTTSFRPDKKHLHVYNKRVVCVTDSKGYPHPDNKDVKEIRLDATYGVIPLWEKGMTLNWRFSKSFGSYFAKPEAAKNGIRQLLAKAIMAWEDACPVKFHEDNDAYDFEIDMHQEDCDATGCVLASAFFPGPGQNMLYIYPTMFRQSQQEQLETMVHEIGHVFGLRHFFANLETGYPSVLFGTDNPISIMNYGDKSTLTPIDILDLKTLYALVWGGQLTEINGTKIKLFKPYHIENQNNLLEFQPRTVEVKELAAKYYAKVSVLGLTGDGKEEEVNRMVKRAILNVKGNYTTDPNDLPDGMNLKDNLLYNANEYIMLAMKLNEFIPPGKAQITMAEMNKCKTVADCITLMNSKI